MKSICKSLLILTVAVFSAAVLPLGATECKVTAVASLPSGIHDMHAGVSGAFIGMSGNTLIVAGGSDFPGLKPWEGGLKKYYDTIYLLTVRDGKYECSISDVTFPVPAGGGCAASDGKTLYFASNRPGGQGGSDLWKTELSESGTWSSPVNLGPRINTPGDENSPFLHPDGKTLYFASNGHPGLGGRDLFVCRMDENGQWGVPQNLGFPINTFGDEATLSVNAQGDTAYFSSDNLGGFGKRDIYAFALHEKARPATVSFMEGHVTDFKKRKPVPARFELISLETGLVRIESSASTEDGRFLVCLPTDEEFALNISAPGYLFYSEHIALDSRFKQEPMRKEIRLHPIESGASVILENIFYAVEQYRLEEKSIAELDKVYRFLLQHPSVRIEVGGHTDDSGPAAFNKELSQKRAQAVADYLIGRGIEASRIEAKGYGFDHPIGDNRTEEGRTKNRRTELKIL